MSYETNYQARKREQERRDTPEMIKQRKQNNDELRRILDQVEKTCGPTTAENYMEKVELRNKLWEEFCKSAWDVQ